MDKSVLKSRIISMFGGLAKKRLELSRELVLPVIFLSLLMVPWFLGGRDPFALVVQSGLSLLLLVSWVLLSRDRALSVSLHPRGVLVPGLVLIGTAFLSLIWSVSRFESLVTLTTLLSATVVFVVARDVFRNARARGFLVKIFLLTAAIVSAIGLGMYVTGDYERATSLFFWPNPFATFLLATLPFSLDLAIRTSKDRPSVWVYLSLLLGTAFVVTYSRAAWLIALVLLGLVWWRAQDKKKANVVILGVAAASIAFGLAVTGMRTNLAKPVVGVAGRLTESVNSQSVVDRLDFWREGSAMFAEKPLLGWGVGTYKEVHPAFQKSAITATNNPHSLPVQIMVELGVVGLVAFIVMALGLVAYLWKERRVKRSPTVWSARIALIAVVLHSFVDLVTNYPTLILILFVLLALSLPIPQEHGEFRLRNRQAMLGFGLAVLATLFATWFNYQLYLARIDQAFIDAIAPLDMRDAGERYDALVQESVVPPDTLSQAALFWIDMYDMQETPQIKYAQRAAQLATEATAREPRDAKHWYALGNANERLGKTTEALSAYRRAVELDPHNNPQYQVSYAQALAREGFTREALVVLQSITQEYTDAVIANRNFVRIADRIAIALTLQAKLQLEAGDKVSAAQSLARARLLSPDYQPAIDFQNQLQN